jgi:hypothetical protein
MTYMAMKKIIQAGSFDKEDVMEKLDIFLAGNRITKEQYKELSALVTNGSH